MSRLQIIFKQYDIYTFGLEGLGMGLQNLPSPLAKKQLQSLYDLEVRYKLHIHLHINSVNLVCVIK